MPSSRWKKPSLLAVVMTTGAVLLMTAFGVWQLQRLAWKEALIHRLEAATEAPPLLDLPADDASLEALGFRKALLEGEFLHDKEFHLVGRRSRGKAGYHILTPFKLNNSRMILLNRGWVPMEKKEPETRPAGQVTGMQSLTVMLRTDRQKPFLALVDNDPAKNVWFYADIPAMRAASGLPLLSYHADVIGIESPGGLPAPLDGIIKLRNDHLGYAITWFSIALAALVIFVLYHRQPNT